jgi:hypothetical protein
MPTFIYYVAFAIEIKLFYGLIDRGPMEMPFWTASGGKHIGRFNETIASQG